VLFLQGIFKNIFVIFFLINFQSELSPLDGSSVIFFYSFTILKDNAIHPCDASHPVLR